MRALRSTLAAPAIIAAACVTVSPMAAQDLGFLRETSVRWEGLKAWEASLPPPDSATLRRLGFCPGVASADGNFHWIDVDGDALPDLVFSGFVQWCGDSPEGMTTVVYLNRGERLVLALDGGGVIARIWRPVPGQPVSFLLRYAFGDSPQVSYYDYHVPHRDGDRLTFRMTGHYAAADETQLPERYLGRPAPVRVVQDGAALRASIELEPERIVAVLRAGKAGVALAEATARDGRQWLFVAIEPDADGEFNLPGERLPTLLGWVEARSVERMRPVRPGARVTDMRPFGSQP